jgi:hypothetical protein
MTIGRSRGVTVTERLLAEFCDKSFLKLWSYPNPLKDDGDEFCDLLAVFEDHVFIFFDRENRQLADANKDPLVLWERWKRNTVDAQVRTAHGAERYLRSGRVVYLDKELSVSFPIQIDPATMIVHKIIVAHGAKEACEAFSGQNVYGSLGVAYSNVPVDSPFPFIINLDKLNPVHVFDSHNLPIIFDELDTVTDLARYFAAKIAAINNFDYLIYCGEEDLLAHYYSNFDEATKAHFIGSRDPSLNAVLIGEGEWKAFVGHAAYQRKKEADRVSYVWDELIQQTAENALEGRLLGNPSFLRGESALHEMAREPRFWRCALSEHILQSIGNFPTSDQPAVRHVSLMPSSHAGKAYVFLQLKVSEVHDHDNNYYNNVYRPKRGELLEIACGAAKNHSPELSTIVGIAIDAPKYAGKWNPEDFLLRDCRDWSDERRQHYERANENWNFFTSESLVRYHKRTKQFPDASTAGSTFAISPKIGRNDLCPCGSGLKYKRCCLR